MQLEITRAPAVDHQGLHELANILVGTSPRMDIVRALIAKLAGNQSNVLITGESGTGKELAGIDPESGVRTSP